MNSRSEFCRTWTVIPHTLSSVDKDTLLQLLNFEVSSRTYDHEQALPAIAEIEHELGWYLGAKQSRNGTLTKKGSVGRPEDSAFLHLLTRLRKIFYKYRIADCEESHERRGFVIPLSEQEYDCDDFLKCALRSAGIPHAETIRRYLFESGGQSVRDPDDPQSMRRHILDRAHEKAANEMRKDTSVPPSTADQAQLACAVHDCLDPPNDQIEREILMALRLWNECEPSLGDGG